MSIDIVIPVKSLLADTMMPIDTKTPNSLCLSCRQWCIERCEFAAKGSTECSEGTDFVGNLHSVATLYSAEPCVGNSHFSVQQGPSLGLKSKLQLQIVNNG